MASVARRPRMSYAEYLVAEAAADVKHEFIAGEMFAMAGGTREHSAVQTGFLLALGARLAGSPCRPHASEARIYFPAYDESAYADAHVVCGPSRRADVDHDAIVNPTLVVEVLSPSTEAWDRGGKFERYESLESVREYALVTVGRRRIEVHRREPGGPFTRFVFGDGDDVELRSIGLRFPIAEVYAILDAERAAEAAD